VLFEPPMEFWDLPADFIANQREGEKWRVVPASPSRAYEAKLENWKSAMLNLKGVLDRYNIPFPAIPEVGITGQEVSTSRWKTSSRSSDALLNIPLPGPPLARPCRSSPDQAEGVEVITKGKKWLVSSCNRLASPSTALTATPC
jgi:hypothetical protein